MTGRVAEGIEFSTGQVAMAWITPFWSVAVYPNMRMIEEIHGHEGKTRIVYEEPQESPPDDVYTTMQADLYDLLQALGMSTAARSQTPHSRMRDAILAGR